MHQGLHRVASRSFKPRWRLGARKTGHKPLLRHEHTKNARCPATVCFQIYSVICGGVHESPGLLPKRHLFRPANRKLFSARRNLSGLFVSIAAVVRENVRNLQDSHLHVFFPERFCVQSLPSFVPIPRPSRQLHLLMQPGSAGSVLWALACIEKLLRWATSHSVSTEYTLANRESTVNKHRGKPLLQAAWLEYHERPIEKSTSETATCSQ